jgi:hypothetical protein
MTSEHIDTSLKKLEDIIEEKIDILESKICIFLDFIDDSIKYERTPLVSNAIEDLGKMLEELSETYIFKASNYISDQEMVLAYVSKALVVNPNIKVKENYTFIKPDLGVLLENGAAAVITPCLMIQIPPYEIFNQILGHVKEGYKNNPDSIMANILIGELKEDAVSYN